ncbi:MAG: hypothetical protein Q9225_004897 [Loekoesia sp. 1 TL-2023]
MTDPLTITIAVASSVATAGKLLNSINSYRAKFKASDLSALSIKVQCDCVLVALGQIQTTLVSKQQLATRLMSDESISGQSLKSVLGACEITFLVVVDKLLTIDKCIHKELNRSSTKEKLSRLWNESEINELGQNISRLSDGLNLLLTALNTKSQLGVLEVLTSERASIILEKVACDASSILSSGQNESITSRVASIANNDDLNTEDVGPKDLMFDQEVLMTPAHRKVHISCQRNLLGSRTELVGLEDFSIESSHDPKLIDKIQEGRTGLSNAKSPAEIPTVPKLGENKTASGELMANCYALVETSDTKISQAAMAETSEENKERKLNGEMRMKENLTRILTKETSLYEFWPVQARRSLSDKMDWRRRYSRWVTPTEIIMIGQNIQDISGRMVDVICHIRSLKTLHLNNNEIDHLPLNLKDLSDLKFLNVACNKLTDLPIILALMSKLKTIYAHANPYRSARLQIWQAQHGAYHPFPIAEQRATRELKEALHSDSAFTMSRIADEKEDYPARSDKTNQEGWSHPSDDSNDPLIHSMPKVLKKKRRLERR